MKKGICLLLCVVLIGASWTACASQKSADELLPADAAHLYARLLEKADAVEVSDDAVSFTDGAGQILTIAKQPCNIAVLYASFATLWVEAGGTVQGCLGGRSAVELYIEQIGRDITTDIGTTVLSDSAQASRWDIERILSAHPDLILCSTAMDGYATISGPAAAAGIPVVAVDYADFADYLKWFKIFCHLTGHPALWDEVAMRALNEVIEVILSCQGGEVPRVLGLFTGVSTLKATTPNTVLGAMIKALGGENVAEGVGLGSAEHIEMSLESVFVADPDVILIQCHTGVEDARALVEQLYGEHPVWQSLRAVREGRVYYLEKSLFHNKPNHRFADAYRVLSGYLYS